MMSFKGYLVFAFTSLQIMGGLNGAKDALEAQEAAQSHGTEFKAELSRVMKTMTTAQDRVNTLGWIGYASGVEVVRHLSKHQPS